MRRLLKTLPLVAVLAAPAPTALSAAGREVFSRVKIELRQESSPEPNLKSTGTYGNRQKFVNPHWLVIRIDFTPTPEGTARNAWCDGIELAVRAVYTGPGAKEYTAFTGTTKFWTVRLDGRTHSALMAIPPVLLDRYVSAAPGVAAGTAVSKSQMKVEAVFRDSSGIVLGRGYLNCDASSFNRIFRAAGKRVVQGAVLPRDLTPWRYQPQAYYDVVCPAGVESGTVPESAGDPPAPVGDGGKVLRKAPRK